MKLFTTVGNHIQTGLFIDLLDWGWGGEGLWKPPFSNAENLSARPAYSGLADFAWEKTLPLYFVDEKHLVGI